MRFFEGRTYVAFLGAVTRVLFIMQLVLTIFVAGVIAYIFLFSKGQLSNSIELSFVPLQSGIEATPLQEFVTSARLEYNSGTLRFRAPAGRSLLTLLIFGGLLLQMVIGLLIVRDLRNMYLGFLSKPLFYTKAVRLLRRIGVWVILLSPFSYLRDWLAYRYLSGAFSIPGLTLQPAKEFDVKLLLTGIIIMLVAELFRLTGAAASQASGKPSANL